MLVNPPSNTRLIRSDLPINFRSVHMLDLLREIKRMIIGSDFIKERGQVEIFACARMYGQLDTC
jgi:hypothetical protein